MYILEKIIHGSLWLAVGDLRILVPKSSSIFKSFLFLLKGAPTAVALNATPIAYPGSPLHLNVEFCANPPAHAARWLHGDRVFTPGNQYGATVLAYAVKVRDNK